MDLIPLPKEAITKIDRLKQIREKLRNKNKNHEDKILDKTCEKLINYLSKGNKFNLVEINDLIMGMHKSLIFMGTRRQHLQKKEKYKM